jgi:hypothetical protein
MYDRFSDTGKHSAEWVRITKEFLKLAFAGVHCEVSCPCTRCENRRMLREYEMYAHAAKKEFMLNYLLWLADESVVRVPYGNQSLEALDEDVLLLATVSVTPHVMETLIKVINK